MTSAERLRLVELRMERNTALLEEIHRDVVGDGTRPPMLERLSATETTVAILQKQMPTWKQRALQTAFSTVVAAAASYFGVHLSPGGGQL